MSEPSLGLVWEMRVLGRLRADSVCGTQEAAVTPSSSRSLASHAQAVAFSELPPEWNNLSPHRFLFPR